MVIRRIQACRLKQLLWYCVALCVFCLVSLTVLALSVANTYSCSNDAGRVFIQDLCRLYHSREVAGNMCHNLCDKNMFTYTQCNNDPMEKIVLIMERNEDYKAEWQADTVVLKSQYGMDQWTRDIDELQISKIKSLDKLLSFTKQKIINYIWLELGVDVSNKQDVLSFIWGQDFQKYINSSNLRNSHMTAVRSILALAMQLEYSSMTILANQTYTPKLYGTCGPAVFVEYTPAFPKLGYVLFHGKMPDILQYNIQFKHWEQRVDAALKILKLIETLDSSLEGSVEVCNIKPGNFGMNDKKEIILLDADEFRFNRAVSNSRTCDLDSHCGHKQCKGHCNQATKTCAGIEISKHLQGVCRSVFLTKVESIGLLRFPPANIRDELHVVLQECVHLETAGAMWKKANKDILTKLKLLLERSLET